MRVVQLLTQARGGPVDHATDVAVALAGLGVDSHVVGPAGEYVARLAGSSVHWHRAEVTRAGDVGGARRTTQLLRRLAPDVVHAQDRRAGLLSRVARARGAGVAYTLHGAPDPLADLVSGNIGYAARRRGDRLRYLRAERALAGARRSVVVTPCQALARYAHDHVGIPSDRLAVVPNGIRPPEHTDTAAPTGEARTTAVWVGLMQPVKRVPELVRAAAQVPGLELLLVGDGPERPRVEAAVAATGEPERFRLTGYQPDPDRFLAHADLLVLPSAAEACPLAVLRAMAAGVPVVASRAGGLPELVRHGLDGLLVPTGDDAALRSALAELVGDPATRRRMGRQARQRVLDDFTVDQCARSLLAVYQGVAW